MRTSVLEQDIFGNLHERGPAPVRKTGTRGQMVLDQARLDRVRLAYKEVWAYVGHMAGLTITGLLAAGDAAGAERLLHREIYAFEEEDLICDDAKELWRKRRDDAVAMLEGKIAVVPVTGIAGLTFTAEITEGGAR